MNVASALINLYFAGIAMAAVSLIIAKIKPYWREDFFMKAKIMNGLMKLAGSVAALAMICAVSNINSTCLFLAYQPDIPDSLDA